MVLQPSIWNAQFKKIKSMQLFLEVLQRVAVKMCMRSRISWEKSKNSFTREKVDSEIQGKSKLPVMVSCIVPLAIAPDQSLPIYLPSVHHLERSV